MNIQLVFSYVLFIIMLMGLCFFAVFVFPLVVIARKFVRRT